MYVYLNSNIVFKFLKFKVGVLLWGNFSIGLRVVRCHVVREDTRTTKVTPFSRNLKVQLEKRADEITINCMEILGFITKPRGAISILAQEYHEPLRFFCHIKKQPFCPVAML